MYKKIEQHKLEESFGLGKVMAPKLIPRLDLRFGYPGLCFTHLDYIILEKQLQEEKKQQIYYQQSQQKIFEEQLVILGVIQLNREQLEKIHQQQPLNYQQQSENIRKTLQMYQKRHDQLQIQEQCIQNQLIQSRRTKISNPCLLVKYPGPTLIPR